MRLAVFSLAVLVALPALALEPLGLTESEFKMVQHYKVAMQDPRVQAMKPAKRLAAIARDAGYKARALEQAVAHAEAAGDVKARCEANLKEIFTQGQLAGRTGRLEVDTSEAQAVAYVEWFNEKPEALTVEACLAAARAHEACPIASSIQLWAQDKAQPKARVFQALISSESAARIRPESVKDFAQTRYVRLFEKLKSVANGDDFTTTAAAAPASPAPTAAP